MPKVLKTNKACLRKAKNQLEKHQMGFDGEHIGEVTLRNVLRRKGIKLTRHKHNFDVLTAREAWEVKTVGADAKDHVMSVKAKQKLAKLEWAKKNRKKAKSMMVVVNDSAEVFTRTGLGKFRKGGMKRVARYKDWRKEVGHGRPERLVQGKPLPVFKPAKSIEEAERWASQNLMSATSPRSMTDLKGIRDVDVANRINEQLYVLQNKYKTKLQGMKTQIFEADMLGQKPSAETLSYTITGPGGKGGKGYSYLNLNKDVWKNKEAIKRWIKKLPSGYLENSSSRGLITHEYGHVLAKVDAEDWDKILKVYRNWKDTSLMSTYASYLPEEMVAEAFVVYEFGGASQLKLTGLGELEELFKKWKLRE